MKVVCEICLEKYPEDELEEHRAICTAQLVFRCAVCDGDYVSKEGLWNHLDLHEIPDVNKESYYQETRATYKLHKCGLCNDQRGYQENLFWRHIHEAHDGFFLQCSECGEHFRSEKLMDDHDVSHCKGTLKNRRDQNFSHLEHPIKVEAPALDSYGQLSQGGNAFEVAGNNVTEENDFNAKFSTGGNCSSGLSESKCSYCYKMCQDRTALACHIVDCHRPKVCNICGETVIGRTKFRYHKLKNHTEPKYKCPHCSMEFHRNNNFQRHMSKHVEERNFPCELCGAKFKSLQCVALHKRRYHQVKKKVPANPSDCNGKNSVDESSDHLVGSDEEFVSTIYHCPVCDVKFDDGELFSQHVGKMHQLTVCTICGATFTSGDQLNEHKNTHHQTFKYSCNQCNQTFKEEASFQKHLVEHEKKDKFQCGLCDHRFEDQKTLQSHMVSDHNTVMNGIQCTCPICGETIPSILMFRHHKLKFHTEPQYQCPHCPRKFLTKGNYMCHIVAHKRKRIFSCRFCGIRYKRLHMLEAHMERRHGNELNETEQSGQILTINNQNMAVEPENLDHDNSMGSYDEEEEEERKQDIEIKEEILVEEASIEPASSSPTTECSQCHLLFSDRNGLREHLRVSHQSVRCEICDLDFENQVRLRYHKLVTHTEPRYECSHCARKFHVKTALVRHELTHRKENDAEDSLKPVIRTRIRSKFAAPKITTRETDQSTGIACSLCSSKFLTEERLQRHIDYTHSRAEVQCPICDLTFPSQYKMYYHKKKVHTEPQHKCPHCEKKFHVKYRLQEHLVVHLTPGVERNPCDTGSLAKVKEEI